MPTLAELRAQSGPAPLPKATRTATLVTGQHLLDQERRLLTERADLIAQRTPANIDDNGERVGEPIKAGQGASEAEARQVRLDAIDAELDTIMPRLGEHQGELELTGITGGDWQRFKDDNPPRQGNADDVRLAGGACDFSAVFIDLGRYVTTWDGEALAPGDWASWAERITYASRRDMAAAVVDMHEAGLPRAPKFPNALLSTEVSETA